MQVFVPNIVQQFTFKHAMGFFFISKEHFSIFAKKYLLLLAKQY